MHKVGWRVATLTLALSQGERGQDASLAQRWGWPRSLSLWERVGVRESIRPTHKATEI
jgi:hypothetical protein